MRLAGIPRAAFAVIGQHAVPSSRAAVLLAGFPAAPGAQALGSDKKIAANRRTPMADATIEELGEDECLRLIAPGGVGRIAYQSRFGPAVLPVNYKLHDGAVLFRTAQDSPLDEDLQTGIAGAEYRVAFEIDDIDIPGREGWSVLIQGSAHRVETEAERASAMAADVEPWPGGQRELFVRIVPSRITGRRIRPA